MAKYEIGQVWEYETRPGEEESRLYIGEIDEHEELGKIYHIYVENVMIENKRIESGHQTALPHAPVSESALDASVTKFVEKIDVTPDVSNGHKIWKEAFDSGKAGVYNIPVATIIEYLEGIAKQ